MKSFIRVHFLTPVQQFQQGRAEGRGTVSDTFSVAGYDGGIEGVFQILLTREDQVAYKVPTTSIGFIEIVPQES